MFKGYGSGQRGRKAEDLEQYAGMINSLGMVTLDGSVILSDIFFEVMRALDLTEASDSDQLENTECPNCLLKINGEILDGMKIRIPHAIRSNAVSERGGIGIYKTTFFVKTGDQERDLRKLWEKEKEVYSSEFTPEAKAWRKKTGGSIGMAILIQEVPGIEIDDHFLPALAGTGYTSYQGLLTIRVVVGLGTRAVNSGGVIYNLPPNDAIRFQRELWDQEKSDAINLSTGNVEQIPAHYEEVYGAINYKAFLDFFEKLANLKQHGDFSLEWVITKKEGIVIVQCAPYEDHLSGDMSIDKDRYFLLAAGVDVLHSGRATCKGLIYVHYWDVNAAEILEGLNGKMKDYLLIVPQDALSDLANFAEVGLNERATRLRFNHFSNASAVVEKQQHYSQEHIIDLLRMRIGRADHSQGLGASHFQQLCSRTDILFVGAEFDATPLLGIPGRMEYLAGITVWDTESIMTVDGQAKEGFVYISKEANAIEYSPRWLEDWSMELRKVANDLQKKDQDELANHFFNIHYAIGNDDSPVGFDPYKPEPLILEECRAEGLAASADAVIANIQLVEQEGNEERFVEYLREFKRRLKQ